MLNSFHSWTKVYHHVRSERNSLFSLVKKCSFFTLAAVAYILPTNILPHQTTLVACWSKPTKESISRFVAFFFSSQVDKVSLIRANLSPGSLISIRAVSKSIPRNEIVVDGPSTFSSANGTPRSSHKCVRMSRFCWHVLEFGGATVRKSSR